LYVTGSFSSNRVSNSVSSRLYYPNPFQPTGIEFTLEEDGIVTVTITDSSGKDVETLIDRQPRLAGKHLVPFDPEKYKAGEYWYQIAIEIGEKILTETRKL
jgi:hypothetical protein